MNLSDISLPYPVLGVNDDVMPVLPADAVTVVNGEDDKCFTFSISLKYSNNDILRLVNEGSAVYTCEYECSKTMMRQCVKAATPQFKIVIPRTAVAGRINFNAYVTVVKPISDYVNSGFNDDYAGAAFDMEPGDILAAFPSWSYDADIDYAKLQAAGSFMMIRENKNIADVLFNIEEDKIMIELPPKHYEAYCNDTVRGSAQTIHSSLVLNALTYALLNYKDHEEKLWARTIDYRLRTEEEFKGKGIDDPSDILVIAQRLLKDPYMRMFDKLISDAKTIEED